MAHVPENADLYVCANCQATYAGTPTGSGSEHEFEAPPSCATCGDAEFVPAHEWVHHYRNR